ncbi:MAG: group 1 truncated hemoglobin [Planctomycetota bacterium]|nr:group 1 truncated hemoglobin [Planctomycetota bacterium]
MSTTSLYERLGGEDKIRAIAGDIFDNHKQNDAVSARYVDSDRDKVIQLVTEFICAGTGGPQEYTGRNMVDTHRGMNINEQEYLAVIDDIMAALETNDVGETEKNEVLRIAYSLKGEILRL